MTEKEEQQQQQDQLGFGVLINELSYNNFICYNLKL